MSRTVELRHHYNAAPAALWSMATDYDALARTMSRIMTFEGLPSGRVRQGQDIRVKVRLFGRLPAQDYRMTVVECDDVAMTLLSEERGAGVRRWDHSMTVRPDPDGGAVPTDRITIDAGLLTPLFARWAAYVYAQRDAPRRRLLAARTPTDTSPLPAPGDA